MRAIWLQLQTRDQKLLGATAGWGGDPHKRKERPPIYGQEKEEVWYRIWKAGKPPCGKRLAELHKLWLPGYEKRYGKLRAKVRRKALAISAAQGARG